MRRVDVCDCFMRRWAAMELGVLSWFYTGPGPALRLLPAALLVSAVTGLRNVAMKFRVTMDYDGVVSVIHAFDHQSEPNVQ